MSLRFSRFLLLFAAVLPALLLASVPLQATLQELAAGADHILVGRITGVDMIDGTGAQVTDGTRMTGPGLDTRIRLRIAVDEVLVTNAASVPDELFVPLDPFLHYRLDAIREAHAEVSEPRLILLQGADFHAIKPGVFMRALADKDEALALHRAAHP